MFNRREFGLLASGLVLPRRLIAGKSRPRPSSGAGRKFLFVFNDGGWDTGHVFTPFWSIDGAFMEEAAAPGSTNGINFVDHPDRPSVRQFFETWGPQTALINGMEVQSVTHERCRELVLTGQGALADDWATVLAGESSQDLLLPHVVIDGPAFSSRYTSGVIRVGDAGQLPSLLNGEALQQSAETLNRLTEPAELKADQFVAQRAAARGDDFGADYAQALARIQDLRAWNDLDLSSDELDCERDLVRDASLAFDLFELGLSRTAMLRYKGWCAEGWDTHQGLEKQNRNFGDLFDYLNNIMVELSGRVSHTGNPLSEEVTVVIFSEMGREPRLNSWGGRDHWTFTSTLLVGSGVQGGQTIGALDEYGQGQAVDLGTGALNPSGTSLLPEHLGATLLTLGDIDPAEFIDSPQTIDAVLS